MAKDTKFGTFGGVFTPSILTILGVIMYLRMPWVVGNAGLWSTIGIVVVAHVISVATGLSISSIATDKSVGAGGPYYIVSRSLGLPIGGTLGLALFLGLSFSISLYIIGFSESALGYFGYVVNATSIRICGTVTMIALTAVTIISTALAIKTQYLIMSLILLSLVSIGLGTPEVVVTAPLMDAPADGPSMAVMFGIFFPAVTGFTAGVNMSGDLRDPRKAIPTGTLASISMGFVVYVGLAIFLAYRVDPVALRNDPEILLKVSWIPELVVAGIWGATLSSALGSILGAPRILQALSNDKITAKFFGKGYGPSNEPRNALIIAFLIGEAGILIAELDAIARIVSMVFLATYAFLNLSSFIEAWASPDFRPDFKIPKSISLIGALTALVVMIQLDLLAMVGATVVLAGLFGYLQRRELKLESGDTWEGIWSAVVRAGLHRLSKEKGKQRNWRPNILMFSASDEEHRPLLGDLAKSLVSGNGVFTDFELVPDAGESEARHGDATSDAVVGMFHRRIPSTDRWDTVASVCRYHGFSGLEPNTVLLGWYAHRHDKPRLIETLDLLHRLDLNVLLHAPAPVGMGDRGRIDVWWNPAGGNLPLSLALVRFLTGDRAWHNASIRVLMVTHDSGASEALRAAARRLLTEVRVEATVRIVDNSLEARTYFDWIREESADAALTVTGIPRLDEATLGELDPLVEELGTVMVVRAGKSFPETIRVGSDKTGSQASLTVEADEALPFVEFPETPELADAANRFLDRHEDAARKIHDECLARVYGQEIELLEDFRTQLDRHFATLDKGLTGANVRRQRNVVNRVQSAFIHDSRGALNRYEDEILPDQRATLEGRIDAVLQDAALSPPDGNGRTAIARRRQDFRIEPSDPAQLRRLKRRRRLAAMLHSGTPRVWVPFPQLERLYFQRWLDRALLDPIQQFETDSHQLGVALGKLINSSKTSLTLINEGLGPDESVTDFLAVQRATSLARLDELIDASKTKLARLRHTMLLRTRELVQGYADDLNRIDVDAALRNRPAVARAELDATLASIPARWFEDQTHILQRAKLGLVLSGFHHRLASVAHRAKETISLQVRNGTLSECEALHESLTEVVEELEAGEAEPTLKLALDLKNRLDPREIIDGLERDVTASITELPEAFDTITDASIHALEEGERGEIEPLSLAVRRLVHFVFDTEFIAELQRKLDNIPVVEQRAVAVTQDTVRLVTFNLTEYIGQDDSEREAMRSDVAGVIRSGLDRIDGEIETLRQLGTDAARTIDRQIKIVLEATDAYELTSSSGRLEQHIRVHQSRAAVRGARGLAQRGLSTVRDWVVNLLYRRSAGVLLARRLRGGQVQNASVVDRVLELTNAHRPRPEVLDTLPFYYRQLFFGQSAINDSFWVDRESQLKKARVALQNYRRGSRGALVVTGDRGSGKSALIQRICNKLLERRVVFRVQPPAGGSIDPGAFRSAVHTALGGQGTLNDAFHTLPERATLVVDDLELWWERSSTGLGVIDLLLELIADHGDRCLFVIGAGTQGFSLINRFRPVADEALAVLRCEPLDAEALKSVITLRHSSTGMEFALGERSEGELTPWKLARLFSSHFDYASGNVGVALRSWITHIQKATDDEAIKIQIPHTPDWDLLDDLRVEWVALLIQLVLHKQMNMAQLERVTGLSRRPLRREVDTLIRMGLATEARNGVIEIDRFVGHAVVERFRKRGLLP